MFSSVIASNGHVFTHFPQPIQLTVQALRATAPLSLFTQETYTRRDFLPCGRISMIAFGQAFTQAPQAVHFASSMHTAALPFVGKRTAGEQPFCNVGRGGGPSLSYVCASVRCRDASLPPEQPAAFGTPVTTVTAVPCAAPRRSWAKAARARRPAPYARRPRPTLPAGKPPARKRRARCR